MSEIISLELEAQECRGRYIEYKRGDYPGAGSRVVCEPEPEPWRVVTANALGGRSLLRDTSAFPDDFLLSCMRDLPVKILEVDSPRDTPVPMDIVRLSNKKVRVILQWKVDEIYIAPLEVCPPQPWWREGWVDYDPDWKKGRRSWKEARATVGVKAEGVSHIVKEMNKIIRGMEKTDQLAKALVRAVIAIKGQV